MKKIYYLNCVFTAAVLASCSSTDSLTEPAPNVLGLTMTKETKLKTTTMFARLILPHLRQDRELTRKQRTSM